MIDYGRFHMPNLHSHIQPIIKSGGARLLLEKIARGQNGIDFQPSIFKV